MELQAKPRSRGELTLAISVMFGGKTSWLLRILETNRYLSRALYVNHTFDTRGEQYSTHNPTIDAKVFEKLNADAVKVGALGDLTDDMVIKYEVICIDEAQFFTDLPERVTHFVDDLRREVYVTGLCGDFMRRQFGRIHELVCHADHIVTLRETKCRRCAERGVKQTALFTYRLDQDNAEQVQVGDGYLPLCRVCYNEARVPQVRCPHN